MMKWTLVNNVHINLGLVYSFHWRDGKLWIRFLNDDSAISYADPSRRNYERLCRVLGVAPVEGDRHG